MLTRVDRWDPFAVVSLIEHISIIAAAFALFSHLGLELLFELKHFPDSIEQITSYGGAALLHFGFILVHIIQSGVLKSPIIIPWLLERMLMLRGILRGDIRAFKGNEKERAAYLERHSWRPGAEMVTLSEDLKDALQQSREVLHVFGAKDPLRHYNLNRCCQLSKQELQHVCEIKSLGGHHHTHGFAAIIADTIAHSVSMPTFSIAWLLLTLDKKVNPLGVAWTAEMSTLLLLACVIHVGIQQSMKSWRIIEGRPPKEASVRVQSSAQPLEQVPD